MINDGGSSDFYFRTLYPLQDRVAAVIRRTDTDFYLTGGTTASRVYLHHRYSDDLDYFVNDDDRFGLWVERIIAALGQEWVCEIGVKEERFARFNVVDRNVSLKIELVNDVPSRAGAVRDHPVLGRVDSPENILANKVTAAIDRDEPKDLADIWGFCWRMNLSLDAAISGAQGKAVGIFPADLARVLCTAEPADWEAIRWIEPPPQEIFVSQLLELGEQLLLV